MDVRDLGILILQFDRQDFDDCQLWAHTLSLPAVPPGVRCPNIANFSDSLLTMTRFRLIAKDALQRDSWGSLAGTASRWLELTISDRSLPKGPWHVSSID